MYYHYNREINMQHINQFLDHTLIKKAISEMEQTQKELTKKKAVLRVRIWRLNQILIQANQLELNLKRA